MFRPQSRSACLLFGSAFDSRYRVMNVTQVRHQPIAPAWVHKKTRGAGDEAAIKDIMARILDYGNELPLKKVLLQVKHTTKSHIADSGKGLDGWIKQHPTVFALTGSGANRCVKLVNADHAKSQVVDEEEKVHIPPPPTLHMKFGSEVPFPVQDPVVPQKKESDYTKPNEYETREDPLAFRPDSDFTAQEQLLRQKALADNPGLEKDSVARRMLSIMRPGINYPTNRLAIAAFGSTNSIHLYDVQRAVDRYPKLFRNVPDIYVALVPGSPTKDGAMSLSKRSPYSQRLPSSDWVPEDITEVLRYVPVHWIRCVSFSAGMPEYIRKAHMRKHGSSFVSWLQKFPKYIDVFPGNMSVTHSGDFGEFMVRRSVRLHPKEHNMTAEQAEEYVRERIRHPVDKAPSDLPQYFLDWWKKYNEKTTGKAR